MLIRLIIIFVLIYLLYRIIKLFHRSRPEGVSSQQIKKVKNMPTAGEDLVEDPQCHTYVPVSQAYRKEIDGENHYFCSKECYETYVSEKK